MHDLPTAEYTAWTRVAAATGAALRGTTLVRGPGAAQVGEALLRIGATTVIAEDTRIDDPTDDPPDDTVDSVVLLHAWPSPDQVDLAAKTAVGWLRPGGWLVLADLDIERLAGAPPTIYPSATLYRTFPAVQARLRQRCASAIGLVTAAVRAGLDGKASSSVDRPVGVYASRSELRAAIEFGAWRGLEHLSREEYAELLAAVTAVDVAAWPLLDTEPWMIVAGAARV